jgi:RNA 3'-terminal phosphate cyclase (ATP)
MVEKCNEVLRSSGYRAQIEIAYDTSALQRGAALAIYAKTGSGCIIGADRAGEPRRTSEDIGSYVPRSQVEDLATGAADQLIFCAALADGVSQYRIPRLTEHVETNLWLGESILGAKTEVNQNLVTIQGIGYLPRSEAQPETFFFGKSEITPQHEKS